MLRKENSLTPKDELTKLFNNNFDYTDSSHAFSIAASLWVPVLPVIKFTCLFSFSFLHVFIVRILSFPHSLHFFLLSFSPKCVFNLHISQFLYAHSWQSVSCLKNLLLVLHFQSHSVIYIVILNEYAINFPLQWVYVPADYFLILWLLHLLYHILGVSFTGWE